MSTEEVQNDSDCSNNGIYVPWHVGKKKDLGAERVWHLSVYRW